MRGEASDVASFFKKRRKGKKSRLPSLQVKKKDSIKIKMNNELLMYRRAETMECDMNDLKASDPLEWWREHAIDFPNVWKQAEKHLAVPATSAPSERAFSTAGNLITMRRCRLKPDLVEDCVLVNENMELTRELMEEGKL